jgi:putative peptidoglycan lipid II flippase
VGLSTTTRPRRQRAVSDSLQSPEGPAPGAPPARARETSVVKSAGVVGALTLASRVLGYVRDAVLANRFGASGAFDAFVVAQTIPNLLRRLVAEGALQTAFVPLLAAEREAGGLPAMRRLSAAVLGLLIPVLLVLVALGGLFPRALVDVFAPGFDLARLEQTERMTMIMMPFIFFVSLQALAGGALNLEGHFAAPAGAPVLLNVAVIVMSLGAGAWFDAPIEAAAWGVLLGGALQLALQVPALRRHGLLVRPRWDLADPGVRALLRRMGPQVFGVAVYQLNLLVVRQIGSYLPAGQLSCYYNATRLQEFALGVFAVSVGVAALPMLSTLVFTSSPVVDVLFRHGAFGVEAARTTADLLAILGLAIVPIGVARVVVPTFYALGDTRTPVWGATASLLATYGLGRLLGTRYAIHGLTTATTVAAIVQVAVLVLWLRRGLARARGGAAADGRDAPQLPIWSHALRATLAAVPGAALAGWLFSRIALPELSKPLAACVLFAGLAAAGVAYLGAAKLFRLEEVDLVLGSILRRLRKRRPGGASPL